MIIFVTDKFRLPIFTKIPKFAFIASEILTLVEIYTIIRSWIENVAQCEKNVKKQSDKNSP